MEKDYVDELEEKFINLYADRYSMSQLEQIRDELVKRNEDSSIIDKAIDIKIKNNERKEKEEKEFNRRVRLVNKQVFFSGLFGGLISGKKLNSDLTSWESQEMINNELEKSNFEEEFEDEDDFYSDDLD